MKNMKKLAALFMAMVMAFSLMAVTAAAYGTEEHAHDETCCENAVIARKPGAPECPDCNIIMRETGGGYVDGQPVRYFECSKCGYITWLYL